MGTELLGKTVSKIALIVLLASMLSYGFFVQPVKSARGIIYTRADGLIEPSTVPTKRNGAIYALTGNVASSTDGKGDALSTIDTNNRDNYPLVNYWSEHVIDVPFHYQTVDYWCGPACLEMVFDYYGEDISQLEIADVARTIGEPIYSTFTDELRRAAHFSNISTSGGVEIPDENITGYTLRKLGYAAFENHNMNLTQLKSFIDQDKPLILLMWYSSYHVSTHYRVVTGYNETHIFVHDPWNNVTWGGRYGGPNIAFNYTTFLDLWSYYSYWALCVSPWTVKVSAPTCIKPETPFQINVTITYPQALPNALNNYPALSCNATISLPTGLILAESETVEKAFGNMFPGDSVMLNWTVKAENCGTYNLAIEAEGKIAGSVSAHASFPSYDYEDRIGSKSSCTLEVTGHDISVQNIVSSKTVVGQGYNVTMNVTVKNEGSFTETFNLTVYANTTIIATSTNTTLSSGDSAVIAFTWNTTDFVKGNYTISAYAWPLQDESGVSDNNCTDGWIAVTIPGDVVEPYFEVDIYDITAICVCYDSKIGDSMYYPNCDLDSNGIIDIFDVATACITYEQKYP